MDKVYEITTLVDLLQLDDDQIDRLCAELPSVIKHARGLVELMGIAGEIMEAGEPVVQMLTPLSWIDDGKQNIDIKVSCGDEEVLKYEVRSK